MPSCPTVTACAAEDSCTDVGRLVNRRDLYTNSDTNNEHTGHLAQARTTAASVRTVARAHHRWPSRTGHAHRRDGGRRTPGREPHAGAGCTAATTAGRIRRRLADVAADAAHGGTAHERRRARSVSPRRCAGGTGRVSHGG